MSRRFANVLKADGLARGDRVAVFLSQSLELPIAHLAAFRSGMISVPLFALFGEDALEFRLSNSGAKAVVTDESGWEKLAKIRDRLPDLKNDLCDRRPHARRHQTVLVVPREQPPPEFATVDTSADDPGLIIYTSGTTGNPKGALHAHRVVLGHLPNVEMCHDFMPKARRPDVDAGRLGLDRRIDQRAVRVLVSRRSPRRPSRAQVRAAGGDGR